MNLYLRAMGVTIALMVWAAIADAAFLDREVAFSEAEVQAAIGRSKPQELRYGGVLTALLAAPPKVTLGSPPGQAGVAARIEIAVLGNPPVAVDVVGSAGVRYDDQAKAFYLDNPVVTSVQSPALRKEAEPGARQAVSALLVNYFRSRPVFVLREEGSAQERAARWLLRSVRIEPGRVVAVLSPF